MIKPGFDGYLSLKKEYNFTRHGVRFDQVLAVQLIQVAYRLVNTDKAKLKETKKLLYKTLDVSPLLTAFTSHNLISTYIHDRKDYRELMDGYFAKYPDYGQVFLPALVYQTKLSFKNIISVFSFIFLRPHSGSMRQKFYIACYFVHYLNILDSLREAFKNTSLSGKKYVPFNSSFDIETLLVQFFKTKGAKTYHVSHGLSYVKYDNQTGFDAVNGENITAENILVWGETSKKDLVNNYQWNAGTITIAGNPKYPYRPINVSVDFKKCIVFLGGAIYDNDNAKLVALVGELAKTHDIQFTIKAHPYSSMAMLASAASACGIKMLPHETSIAETLGNGGYDFAIAYNTTVYYEAMYYNMVCFRYAVNENGAFDGLDDKFYDEPSFNNHLANYRELNTNLLSNKVEKILINNLGMGINKYQHIFNN